MPTTKLPVDKLPNLRASTQISFFIPKEEPLVQMIYKPMESPAVTRKIVH